MSNVEPGFGFRIWHYMTILFRFITTGNGHAACLNTGCTMSLIDRQFPKEHLPDICIQKTPKRMTVRGIQDRTHERHEFIFLSLYLPGTSSDGKSVFSHITTEIHLVDDLRAKILLRMDIIGPERISTDIPARRTILGSCSHFHHRSNSATQYNQDSS